MQVCTLIRLLLKVALAERAEGSYGSSSILGLNAIVECQWQVAVGDICCLAKSLNNCSNKNNPLFKCKAIGCILQQGAIEEAKRLFVDGTTTSMPLVEALRLAQGDGESTHDALSIAGLTATGWVKELLESTTDSESLPDTCTTTEV